MNYSSLSSEKIDELRELFNIGAGNAASTISTMSRERVMISVPEIHVCKLSEINLYTGEAEREMVGICHDINGGINGRILLLISKPGAEQLTRLLARSYGMSEIRENSTEDTLKEFSNIIVGSYLNAFATMTGGKAWHSIPLYAVDMTGALVDSIITPLIGEDDFIIILKTVMTGTSGVFEIYFLFFPEKDSLRRILRL